VRRALPVLLVLAALAVPSPAAAKTGSAGAQAAARTAALPGSFAVRGAPLARRRKVVAGRTISVYARPAAVVVEGCRSRSARVRVRRGRAALSAAVRCSTGPGKDTIGVLTVDGTAFTLLYQETTIREPDPAICGTRFDQFCIKVTGTRSGQSYVGTGIHGGSQAYRFNATLNRNTLTGQIFEDPDSECCGPHWSDFTLTRPAP
jgi:hypothetical protein